MNIQRVFSGFILASLLASLGCSSAQIVDLQPGSDDPDKTLFLMTYDLIIPENIQWRNDCSINFKGPDSQVTYQAPLKPGQRQLQVEVPPGEYTISDISCGSSSRKWELDNFGAPRVSANEKKVNYLGRYTFRVTVQEKVNELSLERGDREETFQALRQMSLRKPSSWRGRLVSAFNGNAIPLSKLSSESGYARGTTSRVTGEKVSLNRMNFDHCEKQEFKSNPVPLGILSYQVVYESDRWVETRVLESAHSFSEGYVQCVEAALKEFKPGFTGRVEYKVNL